MAIKTDLSRKNYPFLITNGKKKTVNEATSLAEKTYFLTKKAYLQSG